MNTTIDAIIDATEKKTGIKYDRDNFQVREDLIKHKYNELREDKDSAPMDFLTFARQIDPQGAFSSAKRYKEVMSRTNPDLKDMELEEIADYMYSKTKNEDLPVPEYAGFIFDMAPRFNNIFTPSSAITGGKAVRRVPNFYSKQELIELSGAATEDDPGGIETDEFRRLQSLAFNEKVGLEGLQNLATDFFSAQQNTPASDYFKNFPGEKINFRKNPKTGAIEFFNPNLPQNRNLNQGDPNALYQTLNTPGLDSGDFNSLYGDALVVGGEMLLAAVTRGGSVIRDAVFGVADAAKRAPLIRNFFGKETIAAGIGGAAGEITRIGLGNALYGDQLTSQPDAFSIPSTVQAGKTGVINSLFTNVFKGIEDLARGNIGKRSGRRLMKKFGPKDFNLMNLDAQSAQELADKINRRLDINNVSNKLVYNVAEATDDTNLKLALAAYERQNIENMREVMGEFRYEQAAAYKKFWTIMNEDAFKFSKMNSKNPIVDEAYVGKKIKNLIEQKKLKPAENKAYKKLKESEANLLEPFKKIDPDVEKAVFTKVGVYIKNAIGEANDKLNKTYAKRYKNFGKRYGKVEVDFKRVENIIETFENRDTAFKNFSNIGSLFTKEFRENPKLNLKAAMNTLSDMKTFLREIDEGIIKSDSGLQVGQLKTLVKEFDQSIKDSLSKFGKQGDSRLLDTYNELITDYALDKRSLTRTLGNLVRLDNGVPKILDEDIFATTFKSFDPAIRNGQKARNDDVLNVIKDKPRIMRAYKKAILTYYRRKVLDDDMKPNLKKHENFMNIYEYPLKQTFGDEFKDIRKIGGLFKNVQKDEKRAEELLNNMKKNTQLRVLNLDNKQIVEDVFDVKDLNTLKQVVSTLEKSPNDLKAFQKIIAERIERNAYEETQDGLNRLEGLNFTAFRNFIDDKKGYGKALKIVFRKNPQYLEDLETLKNAMRVTSKTTKEGKEPVLLESALNHIIRSRIGIFTPEGRVFTAIVGMSQKAYQKRMAAMLSDPDAVKKLAQLNNIKVPKKYNTIEKVNDFLSRNQLYNELISKTFGYATGTYPISVPTEEGIKQEITKQNRDKVSLISDEGIIGPPESGTENIIDADPERKLADATQPNINIFQPSEPQQIAAADLPVPAIAPTRASGIGALNPQAQAANFAGLFPEDNLGQAIAQRGNKIG